MCFVACGFYLFCFHSLLSGPASFERHWKGGIPWMCVCVCVCVCVWSGYHFWEMDDCKTVRPAYLWVNDITSSLLNALPRQIGLSCPLWLLILPRVNFIPPLSLSFSNLEMLLLKFGTKGDGWRTRNRT